jgi:hypothetical protein
MNSLKATVIDLPDCQAILAGVNEIVFRLHDFGDYAMPVGATNIQDANFRCPKCGVGVRLTFVRYRAVLSCHCFTAACRPPLQRVFIDQAQWQAWLNPYLSREEKNGQLHAN